MPSKLRWIGSPQIKHVMEMLGLPSFLLDVSVDAAGQGQFRFSHVSGQHERETGIDAAALVGKAPHDVLPQRQADTVVANYERCRAKRGVESYEEILELASGSRWWRTTLSPIFGAGKDGPVTQILGVALDVTESTLQEIELTQQLSAQKAAAEKVRAFATNSMLDSKSPLRSVLAHLDMVREGFLDLGDGKSQHLDSIQTVVVEAIAELDEVLHSTSHLRESPVEFVEIDLAHMCRDIAALVDPEGRISMSLPSHPVLGDWAVTQVVLRCLLEQATLRAVSVIDVAVEASGKDTLAFTISDDSAFEQSGVECVGDIAMAAALVKERGGAMTTTSCLNEGATVCVTLPGHMHEMQAAQPDARAS
ncbi:PAS domain S-box-containing protein [Litoreibacter halocynthiae]|uniref:PAS domain S-box-containing protein n=1 Tax=Litoreibacter halocynthiae TaxID=1242689 RepID=A0A4R7LHI2_9RHOB|nr:PAS domain-containing protein [Litoreibacter halocynthiae]TDT73976.1 PAS domain S-box-containing protein [Litoreibacter halocynthiae]